MLEKLAIYNFQAQRELILDLSPTITTIIGETDVGKSSSLRALVWALTNESRKNITSWDQDETRIEIVAEGNFITRLKNKKKNVYILNGTEYACLRAGVPPEIDSILNLCPDSIQPQFAPTFWFTNTGGELAKKLNAIINLEVIDFTFSNLNSKILKNKGVMDVYNERLEKRRKQKEKFEKLPILQEKLSIADTLQKKIAKNSKDIARLRKLIDDAHRLSSFVNNAVKQAEIVKEWLSISKDTFEQRNSIIKIQKVLNRYDNAKRIKAPEIPGELFDECSKLFEKVTANSRSSKKLSSLLDSYSKVREEQERQEERLIFSEKKLKEAMDGRCPLCGRGKSLQEHLDECCVHYDLEGKMK